MLGPVGRAIHFEEPSPFEDAIDDGIRKVRVVEDASPGLEVFVGGEEHGAGFEVALVHDVEQNVGRVRPIGEVADLITDEDVGLRVANESRVELAFA